MPVNAPQFGAAANGPAAPAANSSPFNFLAAGSTNSAIPDFKTIAASFFATPTVSTDSAPVATKSATSKPTGPLLPRERESNKDKDARGSELPSAFLPMLPWHPLPTLTPQAPNHTQPMSPSLPSQAKDNSSAPACVLPVVSQPQDLNQILSQSTAGIAPRNNTAIQGPQNTNDVGKIDLADQPARLAVNETKSSSPEFLSSSITTDKPQVHDIRALGPEEKTKQVATPEVKPLQIFQDTTLTSGGTQPRVETATGGARGPRVMENKENVLSAAANSVSKAVNTAEIDTRPASTNNSNQKLSTKIEKPVVPVENKKSSQTMQPIETAQDNATEIEPSNSAAGTDQTSAPQAATPQTVEEAIKAVIPQAVVLEHNVIGQALVHSTHPDAAQPTKLAGSKSNQSESDSAEVSAAAPAISEKATTEGLNNLKTSPVVDSNPKVTAVKSKTDTTIKKAQRSTIENQSDPVTATNALHRPESTVVSSSQNTTSKDHDTVTPQLNMGPHAKSSSAKNVPDASDLASSSTTQVPDADDAAPTPHAGINTAKLVQGLTQSELRVGLQTREFGNIDIRTSASRHEFSAQISVEHSEVAHTLNSDLPNLYARLNEQQVSVANIHIHDQSLSTSSGLDQRSQQSSPQQQGSGAVRQQMEPALPSIHEVLGSTDRLDIRV